MLQKYVFLELAHDELKKSYLEQETVSPVDQFPNNVIRKYIHIPTLGSISSRPLKFTLNAVLLKKEVEQCDLFQLQNHTTR